MITALVVQKDDGVVWKGRGNVSAVRENNSFLFLVFFPSRLSIFKKLLCKLGQCVFRQRAGVWGSREKSAPASKIF